MMSPPAPQSSDDTLPAHLMPAWASWLVWLVLLALLLAVFGMYLQPDFLLTLADQLWSCL